MNPYTLSKRSSFIHPPPPPPPPPLSSSLMLSSSHHHPQGNFITSSSSSLHHYSRGGGAGGGAEGSFEDLNASFRSLYRSLFDSVGGTHFPMLSSSSSSSPSSVTEVGVVTTPHATGYGRLPTSELSSSQTKLDSSLTSVMDSLRDLADNNQWDTLSPTTIQSLWETVNEGDHAQFGMDHASFAKWSDSFNQFLNQLNSHVPSSSSHFGGSVGGAVSAHYPQYHHQTAPPPPPYVPSLRAVGSVHSPPLLYDHTHKDPPPFSSVATDLLNDAEEEDEFDWSKLV